MEEISCTVQRRPGGLDGRASGDDEVEGGLGCKV